MTLHQGVTKRCRLSWLTNSTLVYEPKCGGESWSCGVSANEYSCAHGAQINFGDLTPYLTLPCMFACNGVCSYSPKCPAMLNHESSRYLGFSVVDAWHFGTDPDSRISATDLRIRLLLFSPVADKMPTKSKFFFQSFFSLWLFERTFTLVCEDKKSKRSKKIAEIKVFLLFSFLMEGSGSESVQIMTDPDPG